MQLERDYRDALSSFATGVGLVSTHHQGVGKAMTINSFASVSLEPRLVLWSLDRKTQRFAAYDEADHFAIHILKADQKDVAMHFARQDDVSSIIQNWRLNDHNVPITDDALARFECRRYAHYEGGDHVIIVGEVIAFARLSDDPALVFHNSQFSKL